MTKEEKIKEAWRSNYNEFSEYIDSDGWARYPHFQKQEMIEDVRPIEFRSQGTDFRPKSLQGIETNNGWIKIESEDDLPKEHDELFEVGLLDNQGNFNHEKKRCSGKSVKWMWVNKLISHYQPIIKPKPPIY